jgi:hypothetical protein
LKTLFLSSFNIFKGLLMIPFLAIEPSNWGTAEAVLSPPLPLNADRMLLWDSSPSCGRQQGSAVVSTIGGRANAALAISSSLRRRLPPLFSVTVLSEVVNSPGLLPDILKRPVN